MDRNLNILLNALALYKEKDNRATIRSIAPLCKLTERELEIAVNKAIENGYLEELEGFVSPIIELNISKDGLIFLSNIRKSYAKEPDWDVGCGAGLLGIRYEHRFKIDDEALLVKEKQLNKKEMRSTHDWKQLGSHPSGAGQITKTQWYPMGSYCRKCGMNIKSFNNNPSKCKR